jgi:RhtB (resistance to homoserine/threonine) family protein
MMDAVHDLAPFLAIAFVLIVTPGADMALVAKNTLAAGRRAALASVIGVIVGNLIWTVAAAAGAAAVLRASATAFTALKIVGAAYLVYLGLTALWSARRHLGRPDLVPASPRSHGSAFRQGLLSNLLNPKVAVFFTSFIPQFVEPSDSQLLRPLMLGTTFALLGCLWLIAYAVAISAVGTLFRRPRVRAALDGVTGCVLIGFGVRLALERR